MLISFPEIWDFNSYDIIYKGNIRINCMEKIKLDDINNISNKILNKIAEDILNGKIAILPTNTIYGISCAYDNIKALGRVYKIKKRNKKSSFIILISNISNLNNLAEYIDVKYVRSLVDNYWNIKNPQPLTMIFKRNKSLDPLLTGGGDSIAIRLAGLKFLRQLIDISGPVISTSATISGQKLSPKDTGSIPSCIRESVDIIVEYPKALPGIESTILDVTGKRPVIIREGRIKYNSILEKINL
jgi:L-threonylcarbamoyladenylate synthase